MEQYFLNGRTRETYKNGELSCSELCNARKAQVGFCADYDEFHKEYEILEMDANNAH